MAENVTTVGVSKYLIATQTAPSAPEGVARTESPSGVQSSACALCALSCACVRTFTIIVPGPALQCSHCRSAGCTTSDSSRHCIAWLRRCAMVASRLHRTSGCPAFLAPSVSTRAIPHAVVRVTTADSAYPVVRSSCTCGCLLDVPISVPARTKRHNWADFMMKRRRFAIDSALKRFRSVRIGGPPAFFFFFYK